MLTICTGRTAYPQRAANQLKQLVEISARRVAIAEQVALAKWDSGAPVEDASREDHVIVSVTKAGQSRGLDPTSVSNFFRSQIEANKDFFGGVLAALFQQQNFDGGTFAQPAGENTSG